MLRDGLGSGFVNDTERSFPSGSGIENEQPFGKGRHQQLSRREFTDRGNLVFSRIGIVGEGFRGGIEAIDSASVCPYPNAFGAFLIQTDNNVVAGPPRGTERNVCISFHMDFTHVDEAIVDTTNPDVLVLIPVQTIDGIGRQGVQLVSRYMLQMGEITGIRIQNIDSAAVGAEPYLPFLSVIQRTMSLLSPEFRVVYSAILLPSVAKQRTPWL